MISVVGVLILRASVAREKGVLILFFLFSLVGFDKGESVWVWRSCGCACFALGDGFSFSCLLLWRMGFCKGFSLFVDGCSSVFPLSDGVVVEDG